MNIFAYSDESGTFDKVNNDWYVFAGLVFIDNESREIAARKYSKAESDISPFYPKGVELKASILSNKHKGKLFRSLNKHIKFCVIINQHNVKEHIFVSKKVKQRYLDYAFKRGLKNVITDLLKNGTIQEENVNNIHLYVDEHTTATDGIYELRQGIEQEFKYGTLNYDYDLIFPPILPNMNAVTIEYCNSAKKPLIRAADIIANRIYYCAKSGIPVDKIPNMHYIYLP